MFDAFQLSLLSGFFASKIKKDFTCPFCGAEKVYQSIVPLYFRLSTTSDLNTGIMISIGGDNPSPVHFAMECDLCGFTMFFKDKITGR